VSLRPVKDALTSRVRVGVLQSPLVNTATSASKLEWPDKREVG
jgi:hypothetical protein